MKSAAIIDIKNDQNQKMNKNIIDFTYDNDELMANQVPVF